MDILACTGDAAWKNWLALTRKSAGGSMYVIKNCSHRLLWIATRDPDGGIFFLLIWKVVRSLNSPHYDKITEVVIVRDRSLEYTLLFLATEHFLMVSTCLGTFLNLIRSRNPSSKRTRSIFIRDIKNRCKGKGSRNFISIGSDPLLST